MQASEKLARICQAFKEDIRATFGTDVVSIILYGSAVTEEYRPGKSDVNFLVVLTDQGIDALDCVRNRIGKWRKHKIGLPLFMTRSYVHQSMDSFPIEFLNMQAAYHVLDGEDILSDIHPDKKDLRLQCERELKGKLLKLRQGYILTGGKPAALRSLISGSVVTFVAIFKALLMLRGKTVPVKKAEVLLTACDEFTEIDRPLFEELLHIRNGSVKKSKPELELLVKQYIRSIAKLTDSVDQMEAVTK
ncbi:nucleotidyltransferase domain-containing protein [bacterium]|nr:nucleotidyltransferase domain-containing protein [bacterium]